MVISFTGHRKFDYESSYSQLEMRVESLCGDGKQRMQFLSGMADGFDLAAAEAVLSVRDRLSGRVELHAIVPYCGHISMMDHATRVRYESVIERADVVIYLEPHYSHGVFLRRNNYLVDRADLVIAYYNRCSRGGTAYTVKRATKKGVALENLYPDEQLNLFA